MAEEDFDEMALGGRATFHGGMPKQWRLHELWNSANSMSQSGNFISWKRVLDVIVREMLFIMTKKEKAQVKKLVQATVLPALRVFAGGSIGHSNLARAGKADTAYTALSEYDNLLREISGAHQLDMPGSDDPSQAFKHGRS